MSKSESTSAVVESQANDELSEAEQARADHLLEQQVAPVDPQVAGLDVDPGDAVVFRVDDAIIEGGSKIRAIEFLRVREAPEDADVPYYAVWVEYELEDVDEPGVYEIVEMYEPDETIHPEFVTRVFFEDYYGSVFYQVERADGRSFEMVVE